MSGDVRRSGRWFSERGCILEHQIFCFGKMILCNRCGTSYDLASLFRGRRNTLDEKSQNALVPGRQVCTQLSILKTVSQNCFVFDVTPLRLPRETTSERSKVVQTCGVLNILISKCASRHKGAHFFEMSTSKSVPSPSVFNTFDFEMCSAPQRRTLFRHLNFQKWSENGVAFTCWLRNALQRRALFRHLNFQKCSLREVILAFSLANVLHATMACNCSSLIWPDGSAIAALASLLFDPLEPQNIKNTVCRDFPTFSRTLIFFLLTVSSFILSSSLLFSDSSHLCFSSVHIVGSLTSKLPSIKSQLFPSIPISTIQQCRRSLQDPWKSQQQPNSCHGGSASTLLSQHRGEIENT